MAVDFHVPGPAIIQVGTGASGALETMGISLDGADISINYFDSPVMTDVGGPSLPVDLQEMGKDARIGVVLSAFDYTILNKVLKRCDEAAEGELGTIGKLLFGGGRSFRLLLDSETGDLPWNFPTCIFRNRFGMKFSTVHAKPAMEFYAIPYIGAGYYSKGRVLYNRSLTGGATLVAGGG